MKVALIGQKGIPAQKGGVERHVEDLATQLQSLGVSVYVYARQNYTGVKKREFDHQGIKVINLPSIPTKNLDAISHTFFSILHLAFKKVDVVHFHSIGPSSLIWMVKLFKPKTPVVATFHTQCYFHQKWSKLAKLYLKMGEKICCRWADKIIVVSKTLKKYVRNVYNIEAYYIPNGVSLPKKTKEINEIKKKLYNLGKKIMA